jgi:hypothetical protein
MLLHRIRTHPKSSTSDVVNQAQSHIYTTSGPFGPIVGTDREVWQPEGRAATTVVAFSALANNLVI